MILAKTSHHVEYRELHPKLNMFSHMPDGKVYSDNTASV